MPTYVYECAKCGDEFEQWQSIKDDPLKRHTGGCGGKLAKVIQPAGIVLKGSGFYKNDSRSGSKRSTVPSGSDKSSESTSSDTKSSDTKSGDTKSGDTKSGDAKSGSSSSSNGSSSNGSSSNGSSSSSKPEKSSSKT